MGRTLPAMMNTVVAVIFSFVGNQFAVGVTVRALYAIAPSPDAHIFAFCSLKASRASIPL